MIGRFPKSAKAGVVMLHGRGGTAADILSLLDHAALPDVAAAAPQAQGNSWWPSSFLAPTAQMEPFVQAGLAEMQRAVADLQDAGLPRHAIWLLGFSQGACLALEAYARDGEGLAGVFGLSGGLVGTADSGVASPALYGHSDKQLDYAGSRNGTVWLSVHERDPHIPLQRVTDSADAFRRMGATVTQTVYPGAGHGVMQDDIAALRAALNR